MSFWDDINPVKQLQNFAENPGAALTGAVDNLINLSLQTATGGLAGYEDGKIKSGEVLSAAQRNDNEIVNAMSWGSLGVNDDGNLDLQSGVINRALDEGIGEVSGRNAAREQANLTQNAIREQKANLENQRLTSLQQQEAQERQASNRGARRSSTTNTGTGSSGIQVEQEMATQWLGL